MSDLRSWLDQVAKLGQLEIPVSPAAYRVPFTRSVGKIVTVPSVFLEGYGASREGNSSVQ